jgi:ketosteroid isomerase-like protein
MKYTLIQKPLIVVVLCFVGIFTRAQSSDSSITKLVDDLNRKIDRAVVAKDIQTLEKSYGNDFVFTHGTGLVDSKKSWIESIKKNKGYLSREHDSTKVELHGDIAIVNGKLTVSRIEPAKDGTTKYSLWYVRVFALRNKTWEMISHRTTSEWHHH